MIKHTPIGLRWLLVLLIALSSALGANTAAGNDDALIGQKYEIVGELYAYSVAEDLNSRVVSFITLVPLQLTGPEIFSRPRREPRRPFTPRVSIARCVPQRMDGSG